METPLAADETRGLADGSLQSPGRPELSWILRALDPRADHGACLAFFMMTGWSLVFEWPG